jgi:hypothetical protein
MYSKEYYRKNKERLDANQAVYNAKHKEQIDARKKEYYTNHKEQFFTSERKFRLKNKYGITVEDYEDMYAEQDGCCSICDRHYPVLCIDHCHTTGAVRGLLCSECNKALWFLHDDINIFQRAIDYLR